MSAWAYLEASAPKTTPCYRYQHLGEICRLRIVQKYLAKIAIGPSTLRNQPKGTTKAASHFLTTCLRLDAISTLREPSEYVEILDGWTNQLQKRLPRLKDGKVNFGAARKAINVFMVMAYFNKDLSETYNVRHFADSPETPLDSRSASRLREYASEKNVILPSFAGIKHLTKKVSEAYQNMASDFAREKGLPRGELDILLWLPEAREAGRH